MTYPTLPFALVHTMAQVTPERRTLRADSIHAIIFVHQGVSCWSRRIEIQSEADFEQVGVQVHDLCRGRTPDSISLFYSTDDPEQSDLGIIMTPGAPDLIVQWTWAPAFQITLDSNAEHQAKLQQAEGVGAARQNLTSHHLSA